MSLADLISNVVKPWLPIRVWNCTVDNVLTAAQTALSTLTVSSQLTYSSGQPAAGPNAMLVSNSATPNTGVVVWQQTQGTWTITLFYNGSSTGITIASQSAYWFKLGACVFVYGTFTLSAVPAATGATVTLGTLPFAVGTQTGIYMPLELLTYNPPAASTSGYYLRAAGGTGTFALQPVAMQASLGPTTEGVVLDTGMTATTTGRFSGFYSSV